MCHRALDHRIRHMITTPIEDIVHRITVHQELIQSEKFYEKITFSVTKRVIPTTTFTKINHPYTKEKVFMIFHYNS